MKLRHSLAENDSIRLNAEAETWQEAVKIGVDMLVAAGVVEPRYYQAILDGVERFGHLFRDCSRSGDATRPPGRGGAQNGVCAGHFEKTFGLQP